MSSFGMWKTARRRLERRLESPAWAGIRQQEEIRLFRHGRWMSVGRLNKYVGRRGWALASWRHEEFSAVWHPLLLPDDADAVLSPAASASRQ